MQALVLRRRNLGESDRRLLLLTREAGKMEVVAKGARKAGARLAGASEPFVHCRFQIASGKRWGYVTQVQPLSSFPGLRSDFDRMACAIALAEGFDALLPDGLPDEEAFDLLLAAMKHLERSADPLAVLLWADVRLLTLQGFAVSWAHDVDGGEAIATDPAWVSPSAGGLVAGEGMVDAPDRFQTGASSLIALHKLGLLEAPPSRIAGADSCLEVLSRFLEAYAHRALPGHESLRQGGRER